MEGDNGIKTVDFLQMYSSHHTWTLFAYTIACILFTMFGVQSDGFRKLCAKKSITKQDTAAINNDCDMQSLVTTVPNVLLEEICNRLLLVDALAMSCTCRSANTALHDTCMKRISCQHKEVISHFPVFIISSVPMSVWLDVEWVKFEPKWLGSTHYIDNVQHSDIQGHPFKCCRDSVGRLALLMRRKEDVAVLFQRYIDTNLTWVFASNTLPIGGCRLSESMVARLALWLSHDYADFTDA